MAAGRSEGAALCHSIRRGPPLLQITMAPGGHAASGDEIVTNGGLLGRVIEVGDHFVTLEVADGVRVKVQKFQIASLMPKGTLKSA